MEAGNFNQNKAVVDVITSTTTYVQQPIIEQVYDEGLSQLAEFMFDNHGDKK